MGLSLRREHRAPRALSNVYGWHSAVSGAGVDVRAKVDALYFFLVAVSAFFTLAVVGVLVLFFGVKYRRRHADEVGAHIEGSLPLELLWIVIPTIIAMVMFGWGATLYFEHAAAAGRGDADLRRRQAVDVEVPAHRRASVRSTSCTSRSAGRSR